MRFRHEVIDPDPHTERLVFCHATDLTGNGRPDVIVGGKGEPDHLSLFGVGTRFPNYPRLLREAVGYRQGDVFWYENPGWERHRIADTRNYEVGSALGDVDGDGRVDLVVGQTVHHHDVYWYRQPADPREEWTEYLLTDAFEMYHDLRIADVDDDGEPEVIGLSQEAETVFYFDVPDDPTVEPWPASHCHVIDDGRAVEGASVVDVDGDGRTELIAGTAVYHREGPDDWRREEIATGWDDVRVATADLDGDGDLEVVFAEGDSPPHGTHPARVAWFDPPDWEPHVLRDELFCPHSLQIADFDGDGLPDVYVGEMGMGQHETPRHLLYRNRGGGEFDEHLIDEGVPTHEAKAVDLTGNGRPDIVGKSYDPERHVDVWYNEADGER
jgi:hypothetical protein